MEYYLESIFWLILGLALYFLPWILAWKRGHSKVEAIAVLNIFLGWTALGWVAALVWAHTEKEAKA